MRNTFFIFSLLMTSVALGAGGDGVPTKMITYQAINVFLMIAGLIYFLRGPIRTHFLQRRSTFLSAAQKAEAVRAAAEQEQQGIQVRLSKLESTADESVARARAEAADMKKQLISEAESISKRIRSEAELAAHLEVEKAKNQLREMLINESLKVARGEINQKVTAADHQRLQSDFINHIQVVQK